MEDANQSSRPDPSNEKEPQGNLESDMVNPFTFYEKVPGSGRRGQSAVVYSMWVRGVRRGHMFQRECGHMDLISEDRVRIRNEVKA